MIRDTKTLRQVLEQWAKSFCDVDGLNDLEIELIKTLKPPLNGKPKRFNRWALAYERTK